MSIDIHLSRRRAALIEEMHALARSIRRIYRPLRRSLIVLTSHVETKQQNVAIADDVFFPFHPHPAGFLGAELPLTGDVVIVGDGFAGNETTLEILVDHRGRLRRPGAARDGPGARFL